MAREPFSFYLEASRILQGEFSRNMPKSEYRRIGSHPNAPIVQEFSISLLQGRQSAPFAEGLFSSGLGGETE
jgi:hypothetical protein